METVFRFPTSEITYGTVHREYNHKLPLEPSHVAINGEFQVAITNSGNHYDHRMYLTQVERQQLATKPPGT